LNSLEELYQLLNDDGIDIDTIELAESLWLSQYISKTEIIPALNNDTNEKLDSKPIKKRISLHQLKMNLLEIPQKLNKINRKKEKMPHCIQ